MYWREKRNTLKRNLVLELKDNNESWLKRALVHVDYMSRKITELRSACRTPISNLSYKNATMSACQHSNIPTVTWAWVPECHHWGRHKNGLLRATCTLDYSLTSKAHQSTQGEEHSQPRQKWCTSDQMQCGYSKQLLDKKSDSSRTELRVQMCY